MSGLSYTIFSISILVIVIVLVRQYLTTRNRKRLISNLLFVLLCAVLVWWMFGAEESVTSKGVGTKQSIPLLIALYVCMVAGMFAQYLYKRFNMAKDVRVEFDFGLFIAPLFASPIIFIPLYSAFLGSDLETADLTLGKMMIFLIAFQNGFFWKEFFDNQRKAIER